MNTRKKTFLKKISINAAFGIVLFVLLVVSGFSLFNPAKPVQVIAQDTFRSVTADLANAKQEMQLGNMSASNVEAECTNGLAIEPRRVEKVEDATQKCRISSKPDIIYYNCGPDKERPAFYNCSTRAGIATEVTSTKKVPNVASGDFVCDLTDEDPNSDGTNAPARISLSCKFKGQPNVLSSVPQCIGYKDGGNVKLNCEPKNFLFDYRGTSSGGSGDASTTLRAWPTGGGWVFLLSNGGSYYLKDWFISQNAANDICRGVGRPNGDYECVEIKNLGDFKKTLADKSGVNKDAVNSIINSGDLSTPTQEQLKECKKVSASEAEAKGKTDATFAKQLEELKKKGWDGKLDIILCNNDSLVCRAANDEDIKKPDVDVNKIQRECVDKTLATQAFSNTGGVITSTKTTTGGTQVAAAASDAAGGLAAIILKIVALVVTFFFWILGSAGLIALMIMGIFVVVLLLINPASASFLPVAGAAWGVLIGIGNLMAIGALVYIGIGKAFDIKSISEKSLGDIILKIFYYTLLLNFTLLLSALGINIGYGIGMLLIASRLDNPADIGSVDSISRVLIDDVILGIGKTSSLRASSGTAGSPWGVAGAGFGGIWSETMGASVGQATAIATGEILFVVIIGITLYAFFRVLKLVLYRIILVWFLMITSPIALASWFSPVDQWQSIGKGWFDKYWKSVVFFPAFIFALILIGLMSSQFARAFSGIEINFAGDSGGSEFVQVIQEALAGIIKNIIIGVFSVGGLYVITDYFAKGFEEDMSKIGEGTVSGLKAAGSGYKAAQNVMYAAGAPARLLANSSLGKSLQDKAANSSFGKWYKSAEKGDKGLGAKMVAGTLGNVGRAAGNFAQGYTLDDMKTMADQAGKVYTGLKTRAAADRAGNNAYQDLTYSANLRGLPLGIGKAVGYTFDYTDDGLRRVRRNQINRMSVEELAGAYGQNARNAVFTPDKPIPRNAVNATLKSISDSIAGGGDIRGGDLDALMDIAGDAFEHDDNRVIEILASMDDKVKNAVRQFYREDKFSDKAKENITSKYASFLQDPGQVKISARRSAGDRNFVPSSANMMDKEWVEEYVNGLVSQIEDGSDVARDQMANFLNIRRGLGQRGNRALADLYGVDYNQRLDKDFFDPLQGRQVTYVDRNGNQVTRNIGQFTARPDGLRSPEEYKREADARDARDESGDIVNPRHTFPNQVTADNITDARKIVNANINTTNLQTLETNIINETELNEQIENVVRSVPQRDQVALRNQLNEIVNRPAMRDATIGMKAMEVNKAITGAKAMAGVRNGTPTERQSEGPQLRQQISTYRAALNQAQQNNPQRAKIMAGLVDDRTVYDEVKQSILQSLAHDFGGINNLSEDLKRTYQQTAEQAATQIMSQVVGSSNLGGNIPVAQVSTNIDNVLRENGVNTAHLATNMVSELNALAQGNLDTNSRFGARVNNTTRDLNNADDFQLRLDTLQQRQAEMEERAAVSAVGGVVRPPSSQNVPNPVPVNPPINPPNNPPNPGPTTRPAGP